MSLIWTVFLLTALTGCHGSHNNVTCDNRHDSIPYPPCQHGGSVERECRDGGYTRFDCVHNSGYDESYNSWPYDECNSSPCMHGSWCRELRYSGYQCFCTAGYSGEQCQIYDHCMSSPCSEHGVCINQQDTYSCTCHATHYGRNCEQLDHCYGSPCGASGTCTNGPDTYTCACDALYLGINCDQLDHCYDSPCGAFGTCTNGPDTYTCACDALHFGINCDQHHCVSNPCLFGTCIKLPDTYNCTCDPTHYGRNCERPICRPTQADIIFVLDSSASMDESMFQKQLDFVSAFVDRVPIGPSDLLVSVITFSFKAKVEFRLSDHTSNSSVKAALKNIAFRPGATFTHEGLSKVESVIEDRSNGIATTRFVVLVTDGMSTYRKETKNAAQRLKGLSGIHKVVSIGVGSQVSHQELIDIATDSSYVFSVQNFDALYTIVKQLVLEACEEVGKSSLSDVVLLLDTSPAGGFDGNRESMSQFLDQLEDNLQANDTHFSLASFSSNVTPLFSVGSGDDVKMDAIQVDLAMLSATADVPSNITEALHYARTEVFDKLDASRKYARKFIVVFSNGNFLALSNVTISSVLGNDITVFAVGSGHGVLVENLMAILNDPYNLFVRLGDNSDKEFELMRSFFTFQVMG